MPATTTADRIRLLRETIKRTKWHYHETCLARELKMGGNDAMSQREQVTQFLKALRLGYYRAGGEKIPTDLGAMMDLMNPKTPNKLNLHYSKHGDDEAFPVSRLGGDATSFHKPRWFSLRPDCVEIKLQLEMLRSVKGEATGLDEETKERRQSGWKPWCLGELNTNARAFRDHDLPVLARQYCGVWDNRNDFPEDKTKPLDGELLKHVGNEIKELLFCSVMVVAPKTRAQGAVAVELGVELGQDQQRQRTRTRSGSQSQSESESGPEAEAGGLLSPPAPKRLRSSSSNPTVTPGTTNRADRQDLQRTNIDKALVDHLVDTNNLDELASLELVVDLVYNKGDRGLGLNVDDITATLELYSIEPPTTFSIKAIVDLSGAKIAAASATLQRGRRRLIERMGGLFEPKDDQLLHDWIADGRRYTQGERLPAQNFEVHPKSNKKWLTDETINIIRAILFQTNISLVKFPLVWNYFSVLLLRRPLKNDELRSKGSVVEKLSAWLDTVKKIAKKKVENTLLPNTDISEMDKTAVLELFIKVDGAAALLDEYRESERLFYESAQTLVKSCGNAFDGEKYAAAPVYEDWAEAEANLEAAAAQEEEDADGDGASEGAEGGVDDAMDDDGD